MDYFRHKWTFKAKKDLHSLFSYMHQAVSGVSGVSMAYIDGDQSGAQHKQPECTTNHLLKCKNKLKIKCWPTRKKIS